ncbi:fructosamine kinase family protein [Flavobacteriaceae bacterium M23B6Z8]
MPEFILKNTLEHYFQEPVQKVTALSGGDINKVYRIDTTKRSYIAKLNNHPDAFKMFKAEKNGLSFLRNTSTFCIPEVFLVEKEKEYSFIVMQYIEANAKSDNYDEYLGRQLAKMHQTTREKFGFESSNFIGTLPQLNENQDTAAGFYIEMRLIPQIRMAKEKGFDLKIDKLYQNIATLIPEEVPALVHGDLWSGNVIKDEKGLPCLIDPAVAFAPRETDLAMMQLFGGFSEKTFDSYHEYYPLKSGWKERTVIWQLYYLLVHLNLFGTPYYPRVKSVIQKYN